jgi:hypothetical protein
MFRFTSETPQTISPHVTVRYAVADDERALARLAQLDSASRPHGPALVAESGSRILAALPLGFGRAIADPFEPTAELVALLEFRRAQLQRRDGDDRRGVVARMRVRIRPRLARAQ